MPIFIYKAAVADEVTAVFFCLKAGTKGIKDEETQRRVIGNLLTVIIWSQGVQAVADVVTRAVYYSQRREALRLYKISDELHALRLTPDYLFTR